MKNVKLILKPLWYLGIFLVCAAIMVVKSNIKPQNEQNLFFFERDWPFLIQIFPSSSQKLWRVLIRPEIESFVLFYKLKVIGSQSAVWGGGMQEKYYPEG